jgi:hypothetical protein
MIRICNSSSPWGLHGVAGQLYFHFYFREENHEHISQNRQPQNWDFATRPPETKAEALNHSTATLGSQLFMFVDFLLSLTRSCYGKTGEAFT